MKQNHLLSVRNVTVMAMFGALAALFILLMVLLEIVTG